MTISVKNAGAWALVLNVLINQAGAWTPVQKVHYNNAGTWAEVYAAEVVATVSANQVNLNVQNLFSAADWSSTKKKRVVINSGVKVYSNTTATAAMLTGTGRGGLLQIDNNGEIQGAGGVPNSGAGGHAINVQQTGLTINNYGGIRGGGGAGGIGGTGGAGGTGYYIAQEGEYYQPTGGSRYNWQTVKPFPSGNQTGYAVWNNTSYTVGFSPTSYSNGGYTYYRGSLRATTSNPYTGDNYAIYRQYPVYVGGAGGGAGGSGGYGQGGNVNATGGNPGAGGGNNGGNSGTGGSGGYGGTGGTWGTAGNAGATGNTGASGNAAGGGGGYAGGAGGAAGYALIGQARTLNNFGTVNGING